MLTWAFATHILISLFKYFMPINPEIAYNDLPLLPPEQQHLETIPILKQESKAAVALAELKGLAKTLPNQSILTLLCQVIKKGKDKIK